MEILFFKIILYKFKKFLFDIDLYDKDKDIMMNELLFKLIVLKYFSKKNKISLLFRLWYEYIFIEISNTSIDLEQKF